ncbi:MAG: ABC transporter ATP-binding protein [Pseudomonadales bacterium]|nr:ABC transporter ATP-binding protein [Pseudomonadales bacterium]
MNENTSLMPVVLSCQGLSKTYRQGEHVLPVLRNVDFAIRAGERVAITGASGSGKTTLLNLLGGIDSASSGRVVIEDKDITTLSARELDHIRNQTLGFVYQFHHLLGEFSALENVAMPLIIARQDFKTAMTQAETILTRVGLAERLKHKPSQLSGGERQRVAIARALVNNPACVLMDEPTGNLDRATAASIHRLMKELNQSLGTSFIIVTHDPDLASQMDRIYALHDGMLMEQKGGGDSD